MSIPQGASPSNNAYFAALNARVSAAGNCAALAAISNQAVASVNGTIAAVTSEISQVQTQSTNILNDITDLTALQATLAASQTAITAVGTVAVTAAAVTDLASVIAYTKAQGLALVSFGTTNTATFVEQAISLATTLIKIQHDSDMLIRKIATLNDQITNLPSQLSTLESNIAAKAATFPGCVIP